MADKQSICRATRKKQRDLIYSQRHVLGMTDSLETNFNDHAIIFVDEIDNCRTKTIEQNGRIDAVLSGLDKGSKCRDEYLLFLEANRLFMEITSRYL